MTMIYTRRPFELTVRFAEDGSAKMAAVTWEDIVERDGVVTSSKQSREVVDKVLVPKILSSQAKTALVAKITVIEGPGENSLARIQALEAELAALKEAIP